jgi:hypothetical protein
MRYRSVSRLAFATVASVIALVAADGVFAQPRPVTIRAARVLDGKGGQLTNATIEIRSRCSSGREIPGNRAAH